MKLSMQDMLLSCSCWPGYGSAVIQTEFGQFGQPERKDGGSPISELQSFSILLAFV
jgi:hypothetical protein